MRSTVVALAALTSAVTATGVLKARTEVPLPLCTYPFTDFVYSGCYTEVPGRALVFRSPLDSKNMTVELCTAECKVG
jgi:hypothetical protein